jgi:serine/threonine-protein kinase RsbW
VSSSSAEIIRLELPATYQRLNVLSAAIEALLERVDGIADRTTVVYSIQLATHEACTNIIDHAYAGDPKGRIAITLTLDSGPRRLIVELTDTGRAFDMSSVPEPDLNEPRDSGYGLFLIRNLMDEVAYDAGPDGNHWRLTKFV